MNDANTDLKASNARTGPKRMSKTRGRNGWEMVKEKMYLPTLHYLVLSYMVSFIYTLHSCSSIPSTKVQFSYGSTSTNPKDPRIFVAFFTFLLTFLLLVAGFFTTCHVEETLPVDVRSFHTEVLGLVRFIPISKINKSDKKELKQGLLEHKLYRYTDTLFDLFGITNFACCLGLHHVDGLKMVASRFFWAKK